MNAIKQFYSKNKMQKITVTVLTVVATIGVVLLLILPKDKDVNAIKKDPKFEASLFMELTSKDISEAKEVDTKYILGANIEVLENKTEMADIKLVVNKPTEISDKLKEGSYKLNMTSTPIESDGSTYKIPEKLSNVEVRKTNKDSKSDVQTQKDGKVIKDKKDINVTIELERIDVKDMSKEQLDVVITRIESEAPGQYAELVTDLNAKKETAKSDPESVKTIEQESKVETPKVDTGNTGGSDNGGSTNNGGGSTTPAPTPTPETPSHTHTWVPQYVHHPATAAQGYNETIPAEGYNQEGYRTGDGKFFSAGQMKELTKHVAQTGTNYWYVNEWVETKPASTRWVETAPAKGAWDELVGYLCSCGARK